MGEKIKKFKQDIKLRDRFAALAMQGILTTKNGCISSEAVASMAYAMADAMVKERKNEVL